MSVRIRIKNEHLYLDIIQNRRHHWETLHVKLSANAADRNRQMRFAECCRAKRELQIAMGEWNFVDKASGRQLLIDYMRKLAKEKERNHPFHRCVNYVRAFKDGGRIQLSAVSESWVLSFQKFLQDSGRLAEISINTIIVNLKFVFNRAIKDGILVKSPAENVKLLKLPEKEYDVLSAEEMSDFIIVNTSGEWETEIKKAFLFSCYTGLRFSDIRTLKPEHIEKRTVSKYNQYRYWIKKKQIKTKNYVEIPITQAALDLIEPGKLQDMYVFPLISTRTPKYSNKTIKRLVERAGIPKNVSWHTARRTFATLELESGADPFTVQRLMGHKSITMTSLYAKSNNIKSSAIQGMEKLINQSKKQMRSLSF